MNLIPETPTGQPFTAALITSKFDTLIERKIRLLGFYFFTICTVHDSNSITL